MVAFYKYGSLRNIEEDAQRIFAEANLKFSSPTEFNDPFDCKPVITLAGETDADALDTLYRQFVVDVARKEPGFSPDTAEDMIRRIQSTYPRHAYGWMRHFEESVFPAFIYERTRVLCLSMNPADILMFSHYARSHTGYCLEFETGGQPSFFDHAEPVRYGDEYPVISFLKQPYSEQEFYEQYDKIFLTKATPWQYEREWRVVDYNAGPKWRSYPPEALVSVTLGMKMPPANKDLIMAELGKRGHRVSVYQAVRDGVRFGLKRELVRSIG